MAGSQTGVGPWEDVRVPGVGPGKVYLLTGGSGAMGVRTAEALLAMGANVAITGRSPERVGELVEELGTDACLGVPGDVSSFEDCRHTVEQVEQRWGRLDGLVHLAAVGDGSVPGTLVDAPTLDRVFEINVRGTVAAMQAAAPLLETSGGGSIVAVASVAAHMARSGVSYSASKAAVIRVAKQFAVELGPKGIRVNSLSAGQTPTTLRDASGQPGSRPVAATPPQGATSDRIPLRRRGVMDDYVGPIIFLLSDLSSYVTAHDLPVEGGIIFGR